MLMVLRSKQARDKDSPKLETFNKLINLGDMANFLVYIENINLFPSKALFFTSRQAILCSSRHHQQERATEEGYWGQVRERPL